MAERIVAPTQSLLERENRAIQDLQKYYPDGVVKRLDSDHSSLGERLSNLYRELGYESRAKYLEVLGFTQAADSKGGRPTTTDPEAIISELMDRYEGMDKPKTIGILIYENPDMKGQIKTLQNKSNELFGQTLVKEFKARGLLGGDSKGGDISEEDIRELLDKLAEKYADAPFKLNSMTELKADNPESKDVLAAFNARCRLIFGMSARKKLVELGVFEKPKSAVIDADEDEINQAIEEIAAFVMELDDSKKPKTLSDLQKAYPDQGKYIKAGKKLGIIEKGPLQEIGILAPTKALLKREGVRRAPVESLAGDYAALGRPRLIKPDDADAVLLPPNVVGIDIDSKVELREFIATAKGSAAKQLGEGGKVAVDIAHVKRELGDPYVAIRVQTTPPFMVELGPLSDDALGNSSSPLSAYIGGEVISIHHGEDFNAAQIRVRYLAELSGNAIVHVFRAIGVVTEKDVRGSMEWRYRLKSAQSNSDLRHVDKAVVTGFPSGEEKRAGASGNVESEPMRPTSVAPSPKIGFANPIDASLTFHTSVKGA